MLANFFFAVTCKDGSTPTGLICANNLPHASATPDTITTVLNILFIAIGALAFLMIVIGGFRYVISGGDATKVAESRKMIIYALVGILVAALAAAIVNLILDKL